MAQLRGKFMIDPDVFLCSYNSRCIFSCNGYIELHEDGTATVTATDVNGTLLPGADWKLESAKCIIDNIWKIGLSRGTDTIDTLTWENGPDGKGVERYEDIANNC